MVDLVLMDSSFVVEVRNQWMETGRIKVKMMVRQSDDAYGITMTVTRHAEGKGDMYAAMKTIAGSVGYS